MIKFKTLEFSNMFCFGQNIKLHLDKSTVTQIMGENGNGKSSIALIIEELAYNKNSKGVKKSDIKNRNTDLSEYSGILEFSIGPDNYKLEKIVKSTAKVKLYKNGNDISGHTATQTYKMLENEIFNLDFNTFSKIVNQSMYSSLDFLTATETNRKNFLISLFGLEEYTGVEKDIKAALSEENKNLIKLNASMQVAQTWIKENGNIPEPMVEVDEVEVDFGLEQEIANLKGKKLSINTENEAAKKAALAKLKYEDLTNKEPEQVDDVSEQLLEVRKNKNLKQGEISALNREINQLGKVQTTCPTCGSELDVKDSLAALERSKAKLIKIEEALQPLIKEEQLLHEQDCKYKTYNNWKIALNSAKTNYDPEASTEIQTTESLDSKIASAEKTLRSLKLDLQSAQKYNKEVAIHNSKIEANKEQLAKYKEMIKSVEVDLEQSKNLVADLKILTEALGTKGLIQYKIESMVKVFEELINKYLSDISDGKFVLTFNMEDNKLVLNLYNNSVLVNIKSLSSGEFAKVNSATLLAIRKLMSSISKINLNLVIFDEVISVLDDKGKEKLVETLLKEHDLNFFYVSHGYTHPLADTIEVMKEGEVSSIQY